MEKQENILGTEKISKLLIKFSLPCIISMLVNSLYNIVDQVFIGWGVGYLGNGATNIVFPITVVCLAFALMVGDGTSSFLSLKLGEKEEKKAAKGVANGIIFGVIISIVLCAVSLIFLPIILNAFGCTDALRPYASKYGGIIVMGIPFMMIGTILNSIIRSDGSPNYAMTTMVSGAVLNTILDSIFIFVFKLGVEGAAIATIFSQFVTFVANAIYIRKFKTVKLTREVLKPKFKIIGKILMLGVSSFITQMSIVLVIATENNLLAKYGVMSKYGADIPITVLGIVMKICQILNSIIIGIAVGAQPVFGYNYGAKNYERVKLTLKYVLGISTTVSIIAFVLFQTIPDKLISIFGSGDDLYIEFACFSFRTYLMLCVLYGIQIPSGIFFQAIGKAKKSAILSISRQVAFLIPSMFIFGAMFGINGLLYSGPFADTLAFILAVILLIYEIKQLNKRSEIKEEINDI